MFCVYSTILPSMQHVRGLQTLCCSINLTWLKSRHLELRRLRAELSWCRKIIFGLICLDVNDFFVLNTNSRARRHAFKLFKARCSVVPATFFCERIINPWNCLILTPVSSLLSSVLLANVNSRSRSLYAIARPSVVCLSVCRLSVVCRLSYVTFVRPTQAVQIFGNISMALGT